MSIDLKLERYLINKYISMPKQFDSLGIDYKLTSTTYCPFHENTRSPSAKMYQDDVGWRLFCFSEHKMFGPWDVFKEFTKVDTNALASKIYNKLDETSKQKVLESAGVEEEQKEILYEADLRLFKSNKISISELLHRIADTYA